MLLNRERADRTLTEYNLEALIASSPANVFYTSDLCPFGRCFTLLPREHDKEPAVVAPISAPTPIALMSIPWIRDVRYYGEFYVMTRWAKEPLTEHERNLVKAQESWEKTREADPISILTTLLSERGITRGNIGIDESNLPYGSPIWQGIKKSLPRIDPVPAQHILQKIRTVKTDAEIQRIQEALRITEKSWGTALEQAHEGITEREFSQSYHHAVISEGGNIVSKLGMYGAPIGFGRRTAFPDIASPSDYKLEDGDIIRLDGGCSYMGYACDTGRTAVLNKPEEKLKKYYNALLAGEQKAIDMAKPGVKASTIFNAATQTVRASGLQHYARHHTGHGWGIEGYDPPLIGPKDETPLEEGMVICFEAPYYEVGWGGPMIEDAVKITQDGVQFLTCFDRDLYVIEK